MTSILLVHGWGFDAATWDAVRARLPADAVVHTVEFGFLGAAPRLDVPEAVDVAVGHSMGLLWLLTERPCRWDRLVSVNGFPRFAAAPDFPEGVPPRMVERMRRRLETTPKAVLDEFRARCGAGPAGAAPHSERLARGLDLLRDGDGRPAPAGTVALAGDADPIVPPAMARAAFSFDGVGMVAGGGHLLPLSHPAEVAAVILEARPVHE
ncbi:Biotin synthesis protein BioH [Caenispirillum salinarum AK4]|uniref:Biotin synthesis protein BioH n=1 Tax=Caenispirillum salinarum AK4 TaxID=1238182 RepID=K9GY05_9PROT|nr:alpha/beta fold hydrolase [Caenispirillum salinarum]EKV30890.1 Biotin synthesis protein BioH [Caenispirillum salinarum AK4]